MPPSLARIAAVLLLPSLLPSALAAAEPPPPPASPPAAPAPAIEVTLLEPGDEPRRALRLAPVAETSQTLEFSMHMGMETEFDGQPFPSTDLPVMAMTFQTTVTGVDAEGVATYSMDLTKAVTKPDPAVPVAVSRQMDVLLESLVGLRGVGRVDRRGFHLNVDFAIPEGVNPAMGQMIANLQESLKQSGCPFPAEPLGVGARWQARMNVSNGEIRDLVQTAEYRVLEIRDDAVRLAVKVEQTAPRQELNVAALHPGQTIELLSLSTEGTGSLDIQLGSPFPARADLTMTVETTNEIRSDDSRNEMKQTMTMSMEMRGADAAKQTEAAPEPSPAR